VAACCADTPAVGAQNDAIIGRLPMLEPRPRRIAGEYPPCAGSRIPGLLGPPFLGELDLDRAEAGEGGSGAPSIGSSCTVFFKDRGDMIGSYALRTRVGDGGRPLMTGKEAGFLARGERPLLGSRWGFRAEERCMSAVFCMVWSRCCWKKDCLTAASSRSSIADEERSMSDHSFFGMMSISSAVTGLRHQRALE
jgi:hypothetical protein